MLTLHIPSRDLPPENNDLPAPVSGNRESQRISNLDKGAPCAYHFMSVFRCACLLVCAPETQQQSSPRTSHAAKIVIFSSPGWMMGYCLFPPPRVWGGFSSYSCVGAVSLNHTPTYPQLYPQPAHPAKKTAVGDECRMEFSIPCSQSHVTCDRT